MTKTLDELKAENAAMEAAQAAESKAEEFGDSGSDYESDAEKSKDSDPDGDAGKADEKEAWMAEDSEGGQESSGGAKFSDGDVAAAKRKLRAKLEKQHNEELERIKSELESIKRASIQHVTQGQEGFPTLDQFEYDESKYSSAMARWVQSQVQGVAHASETQARQARQKQALEKNVNDHYERAAKLVKENNIDPNLYHDAGLNLRKTIDDAFPGQGDLITDQILSHLGDGSEKVEFYLGRNSQKREVLKSKLMDDPSGISASIYLGKLLSEVSLPVKKQTRAPEPADRATGGEGVVQNDKALFKKYSAEPNLQRRFEIRRQAQSSGFDVKNW